MRRITVLAAVTAIGLAAAVSRPVAQGNVAGIEHVKDNLYMITGGGGNTAALVTGEGVVLVDTKNPGWGEAILDKVRTVTDEPVTMIINTHTHGDHVGSNIDFAQPVEVVAHVNTRTNMERMPAFQSASGQEYLPGTTYEDRLTLLDGANRIDLYHFGPGHTSGDSVVVFTGLGVAHTGDLFAWKGTPYIDVNNGGSGINYGRTVLAAADGISGVDTVIPGHSPVMGVGRLPRVRRVQPRLPRGRRGGQGRRQVGGGDRGLARPSRALRELRDEPGHPDQRRGQRREDLRRARVTRAAQSIRRTGPPRACFPTGSRPRPARPRGSRADTLEQRGHGSAPRRRLLEGRSGRQAEPKVTIGGPGSVQRRSSIAGPWAPGS